MVSNSYELTNQILYYYRFHKKLELFFKGQYNPFILNNKDGIKLESYYIISKNVLEKWKVYCNYFLYKTNLDNIDFHNMTIEEYMNKLERKIRQLNLELGKNDILNTYSNDVTSESNFYSKSRLQLENFDNILDEKAYECFRRFFSDRLNSNIKGIITSDKLIILYENIFQIKFLYYVQSFNLNQGIENNNSLIQLTVDFFSNIRWNL